MLIVAELPAPELEPEPTLERERGLEIERSDSPIAVRAGVAVDRDCYSVVPVVVAAPNSDSDSESSDYPADSAATGSPDCSAALVATADCAELPAVGPVGPRALVAKLRLLVL